MGWDFSLRGWDAAPTSLQRLRAACPQHRAAVSGETVPCPLPGGRWSQIPLSLIHPSPNSSTPSQNCCSRQPQGRLCVAVLVHVRRGLPGGWSLTLRSARFPAVTLSQTLTGADSPGGRSSNDISSECLLFSTPPV